MAKDNIVYSAVLVDVFNLICRIRSKTKKQQQLIKLTVDAIEASRTHLLSDGKLYLLFDPCPKDDLDYDKSFFTSGIRREVYPDYKANRPHEPAVIEVAKVLKKYYAYRGESIVLAYADQYEADDFVEPIIKKVFAEGGNAIAIVSTDLDNARYIFDDNKQQVHLINNAWTKPYTKKEFIDTFEFSPTPASVTFYKACFGDRSDCIKGAIDIKKAKFAVPIKTYIRDMLKYIADQNLSIDDVIALFKRPFSVVHKTTTRTPLDEVYFAFLHSDEKAPITNTMLKNVLVIRSSLENKNVSKHLYTNPIREKTNEVLHASIYGKSFRASFGKV